MRISDWSSDVCSSDLGRAESAHDDAHARQIFDATEARVRIALTLRHGAQHREISAGFFVSMRRRQRYAGLRRDRGAVRVRAGAFEIPLRGDDAAGRSEEHTSELQSLMRISYAVFCLNKKNSN